ncbi:MAG TPA: YdeI/OmpD-associated family protein [Candidatus Baltobacteraceae bacterium]|nr:YdeI/OmpD-associated family protein [Candidatus Baltobacteraceae bacterium]
MRRFPIPIPSAVSKSAATFRTWLAKNHAKSDGFWLRIYKRNSGQQTVSYDEAVEQALCFGWIDGKKQSYDEDSFLQRFTPRRARSPWSKTNTVRVERLIADGQMQPAGMAQIEAAKRDGRWDRAYAGQSEVQAPDDLLAALAKNKKARALYEQLTKSELYSVLYRLHSAKRPETRTRRLKQTLENLAAGLRPRDW